MWDPEVCKMATLNSGYQRWNSLTHWYMTVAGQTISTGPKPSYLLKKKVTNKINNNKLFLHKWSFCHPAMEINIPIYTMIDEESFFFIKFEMNIWATHHLVLFFLTLQKVVFHQYL